MKVSVIIPTYNRANLVCESIDSVLDQTFQDYELIVIDDGSTDNTEQLLKKYGNKIKYIKQDNAGVNGARNTALALAQGKYIATLDNDDLWLPDKLAIQVQILDKIPEIAYTFSNFSIYKDPENIRSDGMKTWFDRPMDWEDFYGKALYLEECLTNLDISVLKSARLYIGDIYTASMTHYYVLPSTALFRRSMVPEGVKFIEHDQICGDWDFFARLSRDNPVAYLDLDTTYNRSHEDAVRLTRTEWKTQLAFRIDMLERLYLKDKEFVSRNFNEINAVYRSQLNTLARHYLMDRDRKHMEKLLQKYSQHFSPFEPGYLFYRLASYIPGIDKILCSLRYLRG